MRREKSKKAVASAKQLVKKTNKKVVAVSEAKKISLGQIVQKTVEILKKPFVNQSKDDQLENNDVDDLSSKVNKSRRKTKPKSEGNQPIAKPRAKRKKETIAVDYPETSLKKLEKTKEEKVAKQKSQLKRKHKPTKKETEAIASEFQDDDQLEDAADRQRETFSQISTEVNGFFYTNDKFITRFEDDNILEYLKEHYPLFMKDPLDFQTQKKQILDMLQNAQFMEDLLNYYDMNIYEFFKFLFRLEPDLFKGSFLKRVQKAMRYKKYAIKAKRCSFIERRKARLKGLKQSARLSPRRTEPSTNQENLTWCWKSGGAHSTD